MSKTKSRNHTNEDPASTNSSDKFEHKETMCLDAQMESSHRTKLLTVSIKEIVSCIQKTMPKLHVLK